MVGEERKPGSKSKEWVDRGRKLRLVRNRFDLSAKEVADRLGLGEKGYQHYESGYSEIGYDFTVAVAKVFGLEPVELARELLPAARTVLDLKLPPRPRFLRLPPEEQDDWLAEWYATPGVPARYLSEFRRLPPETRTPREREYLFMMLELEVARGREPGPSD